MPVIGWCYRSFANSFTLCLIVSLVLQALLAVSCSFFAQDRRAGKGLAAVAENDDRMLHTQ